MHVTIHDRASFGDAVAAVARHLPTRPSMPVLAGLMLETGPDTLVLAGTDGDAAIRAQVSAEITTAGRAVVSGRLLSEIAKLLPRRDLTIDATGDAVTLQCGASTATLPLLPVEDYPRLPDFPRTLAEADADTLASAVSGVAAAASHDDAQPQYAAVALDLPEPGDPLRLYATDRYLLATASVALAGHTSPQAGRVVVPVKALEAATKALAGDGSARVRLGLADEDGRVGFCTDRRQVVLSQIGTEAIDYQRVLQQPAAAGFTVTTGELAAALKRLGLYRDAPKTRVDLTENALTLHVAGPSGHSQETVPVDYDHDPITVGFFTHRLAAALQSIDTDLTYITIPTSSRRPWTLHPVGEAGEPLDRFAHLVTPAVLDAPPPAGEVAA